MPRGFGGVSVLLKESLDHVIKELPDGNERIQCVEFLPSGKPKLLIVSVYLPSKGKHDSTAECIAPLNEVLLKFHLTHNIIIGGDLNENLSEKTAGSKRLTMLKKLLNDFKLPYATTGKTYINP